MENRILLRSAPQRAARLLTAFGFCMTAMAGLAHHEFDIGHSAAGVLKIAGELDEPIVLPRSPFPGISGYATGAVGVHSSILDEPTNDFFQLSTSADLRFILIAKDPGIEVWNDHGSGFMEIGESFYVGQPAFDTHPIWNIVSGAAGSNYLLTIKLHDVSGIYADSAAIELTFTPVTPPAVSMTVAEPGLATVIVNGSPETEYIVQAANSLTPPSSWVNVATNATDAEGTWTYTEDVSGKTQRFFRAVLP